jgi:pimeloyl-ACP methyl ester carboxylesterase
VSAVARLAALALAASPLALTGPAAAAAVPPELLPPPDCKTHVGYDRDETLSGYLLPAANGQGQVCVPFTMTAAQPPPGYKGDFYVDEFTHEKLLARWAECKADAACYERLSRHISRRAPPHREKFLTDATALHVLGKIDADAPNVDLKTIRRPGFFTTAPYQEPIASSEGRTYTVEFTAPAEPYERLKKGLTADIKLRGWYLQGDGVDDGKGGKVRALIVMSMGGGGRLTALEHPIDKLYRFDEKTGNSVLNPFPNSTTGTTGQRAWRRYMKQFHDAGFDVLSYDRRGLGISGGLSDTNTLQQGRDLLKVVQDLKSGAGVRALTPDGRVLEGAAAVAAINGKADAAKRPVLFLGNSRGTMASSWAMTRNFHKACDYDLPGHPCAPPLGLKNVAGAILLAEYSPGVGYVTAPTDQPDADRGLFLAGSAEELNIVFFPGSETLAGVHTWPALFLGRGLYDYAASLEGSMDSISRVKGLKELVVVRAPHAFETWPMVEQQRVADRMVAFATAAALGRKEAPGGRTWKTRKDLVATASAVWEPSTAPKGEPTSVEGYK